MTELSFGLATLCALLSIGAYLDGARLAGFMFALSASACVGLGISFILGG